MKRKGKILAVMYYTDLLFSLPSEVVLKNIILKWCRFLWISVLTKHPKSACRNSAYIRSCPYCISLIQQWVVQEVGGRALVSVPFYAKKLISKIAFLQRALHTKLSTCPLSNQSKAICLAFLKGEEDENIQLPFVTSQLNSFLYTAPKSLLRKSSRKGNGSFINTTGASLHGRCQILFPW